MMNQEEISWGGDIGARLTWSVADHIPYYAIFVPFTLSMLLCLMSCPQVV